MMSTVATGEERPDMAPLTVALLQLAPAGSDIAANARKAEEYCRRAAMMGADLALLPEMWSVGYTPCPADEAGRAAWRALAVPEDSTFVRGFRDLARSLRMGIVLTYLESREGAVRNSASLIDRHGDIAFTYAKVHTCDFDWEAECEPGDAFEVAEIDTAAGPLRVGIMICYDREHPESARVLMLNGAEVILTPNACALDDSRIGQFRARAFENMVGVAMANYAAPCLNGHSVAFDAVAFGAEDRSVDPLIVLAGATEGVYLATFDLERIRDYRRREIWGDAFRRPAAYGPILSRSQDPAFRRVSARRSGAQ